MFYGTFCPASYLHSAELLKLAGSSCTKPSASLTGHEDFVGPSQILVVRDKGTITTFNTDNAWHLTKCIERLTRSQYSFLWSISYSGQNPLRYLVYNDQNFFEE